MLPPISGWPQIADDNIGYFLRNPAFPHFPISERPRHRLSCGQTVGYQSGQRLLGSRGSSRKKKDYSRLLVDLLPPQKTVVLIYDECTCTETAKIAVDGKLPAIASER